jgi:hypothetical protein
MGNLGKDGNWAVPTLVVAIAILGIAMLVTGRLSGPSVCTPDEGTIACVREWAGILAVVAAAVTVAVLYYQTHQMRRMRDEESQAELVALANALLIDLHDTAERIQQLTTKDQLEPPVSELARRARIQATRINPALAAALQKHCSEVAVYANKFRNYPGPFTPSFTSFRWFEQREIAFRATVLSYCFGVASTQLTGSGKAVGPFITLAELERWESRFRCGPANRRYLDHLFEKTGIGDI